MPKDVGYKGKKSGNTTKKLSVKDVRRKLKIPTAPKIQRKRIHRKKSSEAQVPRG